MTRARGRAGAVAWAALASLMLSAQALPPPGPPPELSREDYCATVICRAGVRQLRLNAQDGGSFVVTTQPLPYIDGEGSIVIYAGEAMAVSFNADLSAPIFKRVLDHVDGAPDDGSTTLMLEFKQVDGGSDMELVLRNDTGGPLSFDPVMFVPEKDGMAEAPAPSCVARPGVVNTHWPRPIAMLVLSHVRRGDDGGADC